MNAELYKRMDMAYTFFTEDNKRFVSPIQALKDEIRDATNEYNAMRLPLTPDQRMANKKLKETALILFAWPLGLKEKKNNQKIKTR